MKRLAPSKAISCCPGRRPWKKGLKMTQQLGREPLRMGKGWDATSVASGKEDLVRHPLAHTASHRRIIKPVIPRARQPRARGQRGRNTGHRRWQQGSSQCGGTQFTPRVPAGPLSSAPRLAGGPCPRGQPSSLAETGDARLLRPPGVCPAPKPRTALFLPLRPLRTSHQGAFLEPAPTRTLVPGPPGRGPPCQGRTVKAGLESDTSPPHVAELQEQIRRGGALAGAATGLDTPPPQ